ncbi:MAG TPA: hypothetical protein PKC76_15330 [Saprospiraceae bacterium]|nr:hypothetical protein [Saprospiraceae bacterium]HMP25506.1 hypothetical protein [Saprospiraceae bacterium]
MKPEEPQRFGVIDLGTNTFHLLIAEPDAQAVFRPVYRERHFIKLAEEGIERIGEQAFARGIAAMQIFQEHLDAHQVQRVQAVGTAALRTAQNGAAFIAAVQARTGIEVQLVSGAREAELIHKGAMLAVSPMTERMLIMDIGGGSVEFIIADPMGVHWAQSFPVGVAVLHRLFHRSDPITALEIEQLHRFLQQELRPLQTALRQHPVQVLTGASGTFDVLENVLVKEKLHPHHSWLSIDAFPPFYEQVRAMTLHERLHMEGMPADRADMIVVALILIEHILQSHPFQQIVISAFAMKEGILYEMLR